MPDGDTVDVVRLGPDSPRVDAPRLLLLHGLEGSPRSHYASGILGEAHRRGWGANLLIFRSCNGEMNRARRLYHSGETTDIDAVVRRLVAENGSAPLMLAGVSLGGNVLLKWLGEQGDHIPPQIAAAVAISVPFDLARGSRHINRGFSRVYETHFLRSLRRKALAKLERYPDLVPRADIDRADTMWDFDDLVTAPVHGFANADDYYTRSSSIRFLHAIRVPTLLLSAIDDPFLPAEVLDEVRAIAVHNPSLELEFVPHGGHVGFIGGANPFRPEYYAERRVGHFFERQLRSPSRTSTTMGDADERDGAD